MLYSLKVGAFLARIIPRRIGLRISFNFGYLFGLFPTKIQKRLIHIHERISPKMNTKQKKQRAASVIGSYAQYWWDVFWLSSPRSKSVVAKLVNIEGNKYYDDAVKESKQTGLGIIFALPHMGNWELAGSWLGAHDISPVVVAERLEPPELFELFTRTRTEAGMVVVAHDDHPTSKLLSALKEGKPICLVADRDISRKGQEVEFFGAKKTMPTGPAALCLKTGATILPVCVYLTRNGNIDVSFSEPIRPPAVTENDDRNQTIANMTQELAKIFETMISKDPTQWHVLSDEWS